MNNIDITVLICVYSQDDLHDSLLIKALKSLEKQTYKNFITLIVMDGCWENTENLIKKENLDLNIDIKKIPNKSGLHNAKNFGISHINSKYIAYLDADDLYIESKLEKQIDYMIKNPDVDFISTQSYVIHGDNDDDLVEDGFSLGLYDTHEKIKENIFMSNFLFHGSFLIKKKCIDELGGYKHCQGEEDWDLWKRAITNGYKFYQIPERLYIYRIGTSQPR